MHTILSLFMKIKPTRQEKDVKIILPRADGDHVHGAVKVYTMPKGIRKAASTNLRKKHLFGSLGEII